MASGETLTLFLQRHTGSRPRRKPCRAETGPLASVLQAAKPTHFLTCAVQFEAIVPYALDTVVVNHERNVNNEPRFVSRAHLSHRFE